MQSALLVIVQDAAGNGSYSNYSRSPRMVLSSVAPVLIERSEASEIAERLSIR